MLTPWLWHGGHTPGYSDFCILGYAFSERFIIQPNVTGAEGFGMHKCTPYEKRPTYSNSKTSSEFVGNGFIRSETWSFMLGWLNGNGYTILLHRVPFNLPLQIRKLPECINALVYEKKLVRSIRIILKCSMRTLVRIIFICYTEKGDVMMPLPNRKSPRLRSYDYSTPGAYFVTICTHGKRCLFGRIPPNAEGAEANVLLSAMGKIAKECLLDIPSHYTNISVDHWVIMPNHVHILIQIKEEASPRFSRCDIPNIAGKYKASVTRRVGKELLFHEKLWQSSYFDHVIRNREDYARIWNYITGNPSRWLEDTLYSQV